MGQSFDGFPDKPAAGFYMCRRLNVYAQSVDRTENIWEIDGVGSMLRSIVARAENSSTWSLLSSKYTDGRMCGVVPSLC